MLKLLFRIAAVIGLIILCPLIVLFHFFMMFDFLFSDYKRVWQK